MKNCANQRCWLCEQHAETISHSVCCCPMDIIIAIILIGGYVNFAVCHMLINSMNIALNQSSKAMKLLFFKEQKRNLSNRHRKHVTSKINKIRNTQKSRLNIYLLNNITHLCWNLKDKHIDWWGDCYGKIARTSEIESKKKKSWKENAERYRTKISIGRIKKWKEN